MFDLEIIQANSVVVSVFRCVRNDQSKRGNGFFKHVLTRRKCCSTANNVVLLHTENTVELPVKVDRDRLIACVSLTY